MCGCEIPVLAQAKLAIDWSMGNFRVPIEIGDLAGTGFAKVNALVDTGATYTWLPGSLLEGLGLKPEEQRPFILADGREVFYGLAWAQVRLGGRSQPSIVVFGDPDSEPLLGAFTLEGFGLAADPLNRRLISVPGLLKLAG